MQTGLSAWINNIQFSALDDPNIELKFILRLKTVHYQVSNLNWHEA